MDTTGMIVGVALGGANLIKEMTVKALVPFLWDVASTAYEMASGEDIRNTAMDIFGVPKELQTAINLVMAGKSVVKSGKELGKGVNLNETVVDAGKNGDLIKYHDHHWWPKELGGANKEGAVVKVQSENPNLHTATGGIHPNMRVFFKEILGTSTWKASKVDFFKFDFNTQYYLLEKFYQTQGMKMPSMVKPGIIKK